VRMAIRRFLLHSAKTGWPLYLIVFTVLAAGTAVGGFQAACLGAETVSDLQTYIRSILMETEAGGDNLLPGVWDGVIDNLLVFGAVYVLGLTVIGIPVMLGLLFIRGFALGFSAWLVWNCEGTGTAVAVMSFLPHNILFVPALLVAAAASLSFSLLLIRRGFDSRTVVWPCFIKYTWIFFGAAMVGVSAALLERMVSPYLIHFMLSLSR